ncbi:MAG: DUF72 domain-containing protein [Sphingobacteriales bacterium]|nr:MAG: DUF72 domain-containing protein [Sphingobacteriales bacterium]
MESLKKGKFYCGTSNVELPVPNKTFFPPEFQDKSRLNYYASLYNTVEINRSFYAIPQGKTLAKWAADVPGNFRFTLKLWKGITHVPELMYNKEDVEKFMSVINHIGDKKGCLLVQFPASIKASLISRLKNLLDDIAHYNTNGWNVVIEFRDNSWYNDRVYQLLETYKASVVLHDIPKSRTPMIDMDSDVVYLRFHGERGDYRGGYEEDVLRDYAYLIADWAEQGKDVYAYFNNTIGEAVHNAVSLYGHYKDIAEE